MFNRLAALATAALLSAAGGAAAQDAAPQVRVSYTDLDLTVPAGRLAFERRLGAAVEAVCPPWRHPATLEQNTPTLRCQHEARESALRQAAAIYALRELAPHSLAMARGRGR